MILYAVFFFSGASALIFEALWFHLTGLTFGNGVWATSLVLASFMGGMAVGSAAVALWGVRIKRPVRLFAILEFIIALSGLGLVFLFPKFSELLVPVYYVLGTHSVLLNTLRAVIAFCLMLVPASAMGSTLPVLVKALYQIDPNFGQVLGRLYGWNTLGATLGVIGGGTYLVNWLGIRGTGIFAASVNILVALIAVWYYRKHIPSVTSQTQPQHFSHGALTISPNVIRVLCASFLCGFILLGLEVIWFRFLLLFFASTSWNFAIMLAMVLAGISCGGLVASKAFQWHANAHHVLVPTLLLNGILVAAMYANFKALFPVMEHYRMDLRVIFAAFFLVFPIAFISGSAFTMLGKALHIEIQSETGASGLLTLVNTFGGMLGSLLAGLLCLPALGMEKSFFLFACLYGITAVAVYNKTQHRILKRNTLLYYAGIGIYLLSIVLFPFGFMEWHYLDIAIEPLIESGEHRVAVREGLTETIQYLQKDLLDRPYYHRVVTNSYSIAGTALVPKRYMKLFVYWPVAVHPQLRNALLICFGCGNTAKALTDTKTIERIDIVDISKEIIEESDVFFSDPQENPIYDPRVTIHIEDGRFFLLSTNQTFDLITGEPPPPTFKGVVNLYTQEYFQLMYDRLADGGMATYWLPVYHLRIEQSKSIVKAFCQVFNECSLWTAANFEWMLVGVKNPTAPVNDDAFSRQWNDPVVGPEMCVLGFQNPEQLGSLFIADGQKLRDWVADSSSLVDNYPERLASRTGSGIIRDELLAYLDFMNHTASRTNFIESKGIAKLWPPSLREASTQYFATRQVVNDILAALFWTAPKVTCLHQSLHNPLLEDYLLWVFSSNHYAQTILAETIQEHPEKIDTSPEAYTHLAAAALQKRDYLVAEQYLQRLMEFQNQQSLLDEFALREGYALRIYLLYIAGEKEQAELLAQEYKQAVATGQAIGDQQFEEFWNWLTSTLP